MNPIQIIGDRETVLAFGLGGVPGQVAETADETRAAVDTVVSMVRNDGGPVQHPTLLLITHGSATLIRDHLDRLILDARGPLVLEIPGFGEPAGKSPAERFVGRVLGMHP